MILKTKRVDDDGKITWQFIDNKAYEIQYTYITIKDADMSKIYPKKGEFDANELEKYHGSPGATEYIFSGAAQHLAVIDMFGELDNRQVVTGYPAYILNDVGKTIQSIYP